MRARHAGSALNATGKRRWASATTSPIVSLRPPIVTAAMFARAFSFALAFGASIRSCSAMCASLGAGPEVEEIEPLIRCLTAIVFEPRGVTLRPRRKMLRAFTARQLDALGKRFEVQTVTVTLFQAEEQIDRAAQRMRQHVG